MLHPVDGALPPHRAQRTLAVLLLLAPPAAVAEVSDKVPSLGEIWGIATVAAMALLLAARYRPWLLAVALPIALLWFGALLAEIHSADVGPALVREQGVQFVVWADLVGALMMAACVAGWVWRRRARRGRSAAAPPAPPRRQRRLPS